MQEPFSFSSRLASHPEKKSLTHLISILRTGLLWPIPLAVWLFFLERYGDSPKPSLWPYYLLLSPLILYLVYFISFFQRKSNPTQNGIYRKRFRLGCLIVLCVSILDGLGASLNRFIYQQIIENDWRHSIFIHNWLQKQRLQIPPTSGDETAGPFLPFVRGTSIDSDITADRWGFRRELPDPYPELTPQETINVLCLGGSALFGMTTQKGDLAPPDWLQKILAEDRPQSPIRVYNCAFPGAHAGSITVPAGSAYWQIDPDVLFFYEAINWLAPGQKSFLENRNSLLMTWIRNSQVKRNSCQAVHAYIPNDYSFHLEEFIEACREAKPTAIPVLMTFSLPYSEQASRRELRYWDRMQNGQGCAYAAAVLVRKHNERLIEVAQKKGVPWIDTRPLLQDKPEYYIDSCHPTQEGSRLLAGLMAQCVADLIEQEIVPSKR